MATSREATPLQLAGRALGREKNLKGGLRKNLATGGPGEKTRSPEKETRTSAVVQTHRPNPCVTSGRSLGISVLVRGGEAQNLSESGGVRHQP